MRVAVIAIGRSGEEARTQVDVAPTDTVGDLYQRVSQALNKNVEDLRLTYKDQLLKDKSQKIASLGIKEGDTIYATILATGGGLKETLKRMIGLSPSPIFSSDVVYYPAYRTLKSEEGWLNREYVGMLRHQPAAKAIDLRHYYFEYRATQGPFRGLIFKLHIFIKSPYEPPDVYCENAYSHPNFYPNGKLCIATSWQDFGSLWEYLERVKIVINEPNYSSPAR